MKCVIKNCNNVDNGSIQITSGKLNIKYGINGTGKSTISKAIKFQVEFPDRLKELMPFRLRNVANADDPCVSLDESINSVLVFNEEYLNQFLFKEDELIANSYEIFIKTVEYERATNEIEQLLSDIKKVFSENNELDQIINDFESLSKSFTTTQSGLSKTSPLYKGLKEGNKIAHIPEQLLGYSKLIKDKNCVTWLDWQIKGEQFHELSGNCPYCTSSTIEKKDVIKSVSKVYDKTVVKNFNIILSALENLGDYFSNTANSTLKSITEKQTCLEEAEMNYIVATKQQIDDLLLKLRLLKNISPMSFSDDEKAESKLNRMIIDINIFDRFNSDKTNKVILSLNSSLKNVLEKVGILQGEISKQKCLVRKMISKYKTRIDDFLINAGYKYTIEIVNSTTQNYKLLLKHIDSDEQIGKGDNYLSFGERNAFALVLFMYEALSKKSDLIILDDPISSFDKNKKYAIMEMLFRGDSSDSLKNKTVLMFTHDLDPVIDTVKVLPAFGNLSESKFLLTRNGVLNEIDIKKNDLMSFAQICNKVISSDENIIAKLVYLRRYYEVIDNQGNEYEVLSNLFHKREKQFLKDNREYSGNNVLSEADYNSGVEEIQKKISDFDYERVLLCINDSDYLKEKFLSGSNNYVKLNIFRLLYDSTERKIPSVLQKFINESYHIENELICQLDPNKYDVIPYFIIEECEKYLENM